MPEAALLVVQGIDQGRRLELAASPLSLGRGAAAEVRIPDVDASRVHAELRRESGRWHIADLDSANGTYVNGQPVASALLRSGDQIQIGRTIFLFTAPGAPVDDSAGEQISLVARSAPDDRSQIVGQAPPHDSASLHSLAQAGANLQLLYQIAEEAVRPASSLDELLKRILDLTLRTVGADRGCILAADSKSDRIAPRVVSHRPGVDVNQRMPISTTIVDYVIQHAQGVRTADARHDSRFDGTQSIMKAGIREAMCVPMQGRYELMGVIYVDTTTAGPDRAIDGSAGRFDDPLLRLLLAIGRQAALAIENFRYQDALVTSERLAAVGQTVAIMSHHIKNILQGVRGGGYLIDKGLKDQNEAMVRQGWGVVERNQERIFNLIMDMLTFSKEREPRLTPSRLGDVVDDVMDLMRPRLDESRISCTVRGEEEIPASLFDAEGIHRAILNIVSNALEALEDCEAPRVEVSYGFDRGNERLWVEISDNGPGVLEADLPRLFNLFESTKGAKGTGLGLAVSRKILQEHQGTISISTQPGAGASFRLEWPYHADDGESDAAGQQEVASPEESAGS